MLKKWLHRSYYGFPIGFILAVVIGITVCAVALWQATPITGSGSLTIAQSPDFTYTVNGVDSGSSVIVNFGTNTEYLGAESNPLAQATITIANTGNETINTININTTGTPSSTSLWIVDGNNTSNQSQTAISPVGGIPAGGSYTCYLYLEGTLVIPATYPLNDISTTLTPS